MGDGLTVQNEILPSPALEAIDVAVVLPCLNEERAIQATVSAFREALPTARIHVVDNMSTDATAEVARRAGARVLRCGMRGKGHALRHAFSSIDADVFVIADGDGTYDASRAAEMVRMLLDDGLDMVVGTRSDSSPQAYRTGHRTGNRIFNVLVWWSFGRQFTDIFSGYRVLSRRFVKSFPALSAGFDIETEMSIHAIQLCMPTAEITTRYGERGAGSESKLRTYRDGLRILWRIVVLLKHLRPFVLFSAIALLLAALSFALGFPVVLEFLATGLVARFPTAIAAASLGVMALISFVSGVMLDSIATAQRENKRLFYLSTASRRGSPAAGLQ